MDAWCVWQKSNWGNDLHAMLIRQDGACLAEHICSDPTFVYGDLWDHRKELKSENRELRVSPNPISIEDFRTKYPEVFQLAFTSIGHENDG